MKSQLFVALTVAIGLVACDSGSSTAPPTSNPASTLPGVSTLKVGTESFLPFMGGYRERKYPIRNGDLKDSVDQTTVNFITSSSAVATRINGSILVEDVQLGTFSVDTSYFSFRKPRMAELSFFRYRPGIDTCYFSAMSGSLEITSLRDTALSSGPGHLISGAVTARMGLPWAARFASCSEPLDVTLSFSSILLKRYD